MKTIRTFSNFAQAGLARSVLKETGIDAVLADEHAFIMGPQYVPWGVRLQVPEPDADRAERVLDHQEGFSPLPDDFVPPPDSSQESDSPALNKGTGIDAFLHGGMWALGAFGMFLVVNLAAGHSAHADPGRVLLVFALGGVIGVIVRAIDNRGRKDQSKPSRGGAAETPLDER